MSQDGTKDKTIVVSFTFSGKEFDTTAITPEYVTRVINRQFGRFMQGIKIEAKEVAA
nr:hypothetical protein [uncultured Nitrososphaera sp.]